MIRVLANAACVVSRAVGDVLREDRRVGLLLECAASAIAAPALALPPSAKLFFAVDDGDVKYDVVAGSPAPNGNQVYISTYAASNGAWQISYIINADYKTNPQAVLTAIITVENKTEFDTLAFNVGAEVPICPAIDGASLVGGSALLTLTTVGPGTVACDTDGEPILDCLADGHAIESLFYCPTTLTSTGSSMISYTGTFGLPGPSEVGPSLIEVIGVREHFTLTPKDKLTMQVTFFYKDSDGVERPNPCTGDFDGDGAIGPTDLALLFSEWGETNFCPAELPSDVNEDGVVDTLDLMLLLASWGGCA